MATGGDTALGGDDFDAAVAGWLLDQAGISKDAGRGTLSMSSIRRGGQRGWQHATDHRGGDSIAGWGHGGGTRVPRWPS